MTTKRMGEEQFRWFIGTVEDVNDPQQLGRVRVRIINEHDDPSIQTNELLWATPIQDITSAGHNGVGKSPTGILVGSQVFGFFLDGQEKQLPMIWGTYAKLPDGTQATNDVPGLARGINTLNIQKFGTEPDSAYAAKYPYNQVTVTRSGHVIEYDDTPGHERVRVFHKSGTYTEINSAGQSVSKIVDDGWEIIVKNKHVFVGGDTTVIVTGNCNMIANSITMTSATDISMYAPGGLHVLGSGITTSGAIVSDLYPSGTFTTPTGDNVYFDSGIITGID